MNRSHKECIDCQTVKHVSQFNAKRSECRDCQNPRRRTAYDPAFQQDRLLRQRYGIDKVQYDAKLVEQDGKCAVCRRSDVRLVVDHCHDGGQVRGLLCHNCNTSLGLMRDDPVLLQRAADYLLLSVFQWELEVA